MNREQIRYTAKRIEEICNDKISELKKQRKPNNFEKKFEVIYKLVKEKKAELLPLDNVKNCHYKYFMDMFEYPGEKEHNKTIQKHNDSIDARMDAVYSEKEKLLDQVHLGDDSSKIMKMLEAFANKKF